jgi:hypothetical protein
VALRRGQQEQLESNRRKKARPITDVTSTAPGKEEMADTCRLFRMNSLEGRAMWHIDPLLGNDCKRTRQRPLLCNNFVNMQ